MKIEEKSNFYMYIEKRFGEDIGDLFYCIEKFDIIGVFNIVKYFRKEYERR